MNEQLTLRLGRDLAARIDASARAAGVKRSAVVRAALEAYLPAAQTAAKRSVKERLAPYVGVLTVNPDSVERDHLARTIREHNWRE
ncbi:MAG: ribbon-helix-helix protein, CopG family [Gemmatimonadaceae bacterium]